MLINGVLYNSEAWHGLTNAHIAKFESVDEALLRHFKSTHKDTKRIFTFRNWNCSIEMDNHTEETQLFEAYIK